MHAFSHAFHFRLRDEDGGHAIRSAISGNPIIRKYRGSIQCVSKKTSPTFLAVTRESIVGFS